MTEDSAIDILKAQAKIIGSQRKLAAKIGISPAYLSDVCLKRRRLGPTLLKYLNLEKFVVYKVYYTQKRRRFPKD